MTTEDDHCRVQFRVNGSATELRVEARRTLAEILREDLGLTGTHLGCEHGVCGACTIALDGEPARACLVLAVQAEGAEIRTVESLGDERALGPIQQAMFDHHAFQCAFCAPGFLMTIFCLLDGGRRPTAEQVREELSGNLCRCTGYASILNGVAAAIAALDAARPGKENDA